MFPKGAKVMILTALLAKQFNGCKVVWDALPQDIIPCLILAAGAASVAYGDGALRAPSPFGARGYAAGPPWVSKTLRV